MDIARVLAPILLTTLAWPSSPARAQGCILGNAVPKPSVCVIVDYVEALGRMAEAERSARTTFSDTNDVEERAFYAMKGRMDAGRRAITTFQRYQTARDTSVRRAGRDVVTVFRWLVRNDSIGELDYRRILRFQMPLPELQEKRAEQAQNRDKTLDLLLAAAGDVLDASLVVVRGAPKVTDRDMVLAERDSIVALIDRTFPGEIGVAPDHTYASGWAAAATAIRENLLQDWHYHP